MHVPSFIARPLFHLVYRVNRRASPIPPIKRVVRPPSLEVQSAFDRLLDSTLAQGSNSLIDYHLPYPKVGFLNYICDWRGYVAHGSPLQDFTTLQPVRLTQDSDTNTIIARFISMLVYMARSETKCKKLPLSYGSMIRPSRQ